MLLEPGRGQDMTQSTTTRDQGLTEAEASARLERFGPNDPVPPQKRRPVRDLLRRFANPLIAILLLASIAPAFAGDLVNAALVLCIVGVSVLIEFVQTRRSERAADALKARGANGQRAQRR